MSHEDKGKLLHKLNTRRELFERKVIWEKKFTQYDLNLIELLVRNGANVNKCDSNGIYPLHVAITRQNDLICNFLLKHGSLVNIHDK